MIDYSYPCMMAEKALKDLHNAAIEGRLDDAAEHALVAIAEARLVYQALQHMSSTSGPGASAVRHVGDFSQERSSSSQSRPTLAHA